MPKKGKGKGKSKKKKEANVDPNALTEVDKTFYELQIADLNRKLTRLRTLTQELEEKNEEGNLRYQKLDEDRNDIIIFLKRILIEKKDEISELQERILSLDETRTEDREKYEKIIKDKDEKYNQMKEHFESENKLLDGKLNTLEEFRVQREELLKKFEDQEKRFKDQELAHKNELYEVEKNFILAKDKLRIDMEGKLKKLADEFQEHNDLRIAATTHRVVQENICVNNELNCYIESQGKLMEANKKLKELNKDYRLKCELFEAEKVQALNIVHKQKQLIKELTEKFKKCEFELNSLKKLEETHKYNAKKIQEQDLRIANLDYVNKMLKQNLHRVHCEKSSLTTDYLYFKDENHRLLTILVEAIYSIEQVLAVREDTDEGIKTAKREDLIDKLMNILSNVSNTPMRKPSLDSIKSAIYSKGDLGFVPRSEILADAVLLKIDKDTQTEVIIEELNLAESFSPSDSLQESFVVEEEETFIDNKIEPEEKIVTFEEPGYFGLEDIFPQIDVMQEMSDSNLS